MKKIVHIIDSLRVGGAEVLLLSTIKRLPHFEHYIISLTPAVDLLDINNYAEVHCLNHRSWGCIFHSCYRIRLLVKKIKPDIIHSHLFLSSFLTRLSLYTSKKIVYSVHNLYSAMIFDSKPKRFLEKVIFNPNHKLITVSKYVLDDYMSVVTKCKKGYVLYNFIDDIFFKEKNERGNNMAFNEVTRFVAVGSLKAQKNYINMITLFQKLYNSSFSKKNISLDIYGEGPLKDELQIKISESSLPIRLMGKVNNILTVLDQYDAYISTSFYEGYGIAPMEALSRGLPLFLSDIPVYKEIYKSFAFYFQNDNSASFIDACNRYMILDETRKSALKEQGKDYARKVANSEKYIKELLKIYAS